MFPGEEEGPVGSEGPLDRPWAPAGSVASREGPTGAGEGEKCRWEGEPGPGLVTGHLLCVHWTPAPWALRRDQRRRRQPRRPALRLPAKPGCCTRPAPPPPRPQLRVLLPRPALPLSLPGPAHACTGAHTVLARVHTASHTLVSGAVPSLRPPPAAPPLDGPGLGPGLGPHLSVCLCVCVCL